MLSFAPVGRTLTTGYQTQAKRGRGRAVPPCSNRGVHHVTSIEICVPINWNTQPPPRRSSKTWPTHSTGVDWLTVTATIPTVRRRLASAAEWIGGNEQQSGHERSPSRVRDYIGWRCGGVMVGERRDSLLCQVSGATASRHWRRLLVGAHNVTRLDVQVTCLSPHHRRNEALAVWRRLSGDDDLRRRA